VAVNLLTAFKFNFKVEIVGTGPHRPTGPKVKTVGSPPTLLKPCVATQTGPEGA